VPATVQQYLDLLPSEHANKPKFIAVLTLLLTPLVAMQNTALGMAEDFDLDNAVGAQLDIVGQWVGFSRKLPVPLSGVYFAWDTPNLGWDQGAWQGPNDPTQGITTLDDATYLVFLKLKIAANYWDGTFADLASILDDLFVETLAPGSNVFVQDNQNMSVTIGISGAIPPAIVLAGLANGLVPLKSMGIATSYLITSEAGSPIFGFDMENQNVSGWDVGAWGVAPSA
jgi:hypothetical protein